MSSKKAPGRKKSPKKTEKVAHYTGVFVEDLKDQFKFVIEKVEGVETSLRTEMSQNKAELKQDIADTRQALGMRIDNVESSLRAEMSQNKAELKQDIADTRQALSLRIDNVEQSLSQRIDNVETSLRAEMSQNKTELKQEIQELSKKADRTHETVLRHDREIASLKKSA